MSTRFERAWQAFEEHDRALRAPAHLEARVLAAVTREGVAPQRRAPVRMFVWAAAAASIVVAIGVSVPDNTAPPPVITAAPQRLVMMPHAVEPVQPRLEPASIAPAPTPHERVVLVMLDTTPPLHSEPLQLMRLRVPMEALQGLGVVLFEHDDAGMVDVDVLVGEDGLPRDVRRVRLALEDRQ